MSENVDELFGKGGDTATPRTGLAVGLLVSGLVLALLGSLCTSIPGGLLVLLAWFVVQRDQDRIESGFLPSDHRPTVRNLRIASGVGIAVVIALEIFQVLLCSGGHDELLGALLQPLAELVPKAPPPPPAP